VTFICGSIDQNWRDVGAGHASPCTAKNRDSYGPSSGGTQGALSRRSSPVTWQIKETRLPTLTQFDDATRVEAASQRLQNFVRIEHAPVNLRCSVGGVSGSAERDRPKSSSGEKVTARARKN